ncbi:MAG: amidohydrolase, partial [Atribacterota bacterium]|nr:amidohydrolase [Atribacterota bacterium]
NDHVLTANVKTSVRKIVGEDKIINFACTASEDFSEFSSRLPAVFIFLGCGKKEPQERVSHHNCYFDINEEMLPLGVEIQVRSALDFFKKGL